MDRFPRPPTECRGLQIRHAEHQPADLRGGERPEGFRSRRARIGYELGTELIGCSLWELPPGEAAYPYHFHYADEELVIVLSGRPTLRTPEGTRELEEGEAVRFPLGEEGAHQIYTRPTRRRPSSLCPVTGDPMSSSTRTPARSGSASGCPRAAACVPSSDATTASATSRESSHPSWGTSATRWAPSRG